MQAKDKIKARLAVQNAYIKGGQASALDVANKLMLQYEYCKGCDCATPAIDHECLLCGQETEPINSK